MKITPELVTELSEALDPQHQGIYWPDPISYDGRPLKEQASDLLVLAEAALEVNDAGHDSKAVARLRKITAKTHDALLLARKEAGQHED